MNKAIAFIAIIIVALLSTGCATPGLTGSDYTYSEARKPGAVEYGTVEHVRVVRIEQPASNSGGRNWLSGSSSSQIAGPVVGAAIGGVIGRQLGKSGSATREVATVLGAAAGGIAGSHVEKTATTKRGIEVQVNLDSGRRLVVAQADGGEGFKPGDRVRLLVQGGVHRVAY